MAKALLHHGKKGGSRALHEQRYPGNNDNNDNNVNSPLHYITMYASTANTRAPFRTIESSSPPPEASTPLPPRARLYKPTAINWPAGRAQPSFAPSAKKQKFLKSQRPNAPGRHKKQKKTIRPADLMRISACREARASAFLGSRSRTFVSDFAPCL